MSASEHRGRNEVPAPQSTKAMRDRIRELAVAPGRDDYDRAVIAVLDDFETAQLFYIGDGRLVHFNPAGRFHGWIFRRHADGKRLISERKLVPVPLPGAPV